MGLILTSYRPEVTIDEVLEAYLEVVGKLEDFNPQSKVNQSDEQDLKNGALKIILLLATRLLKDENYGFKSCFEGLVPYCLKVVNLRGTPTDQSVETVCRRFLRQIVSTIVVDEKDQMEYLTLLQRNSKHLETEQTSENTKFIRKAAAKLIAALFQMGHVSIKTIQKKLTKLQNKHGKICVLTSLILTEPYDVPKWLPNIFVQLSFYAGDKAVAIKSEIQECLKEFKRTHTVGWDVVYKPKFDQEQLEAFYELGEPPSYFA